MRMCLYTENGIFQKLGNYITREQVDRSEPRHEARRCSSAGEKGGSVNGKREIWELKQMQSLPLAAKVQMTRRRIREWVEAFGENGVYVSFSGGKDSTVLLDIVRKDYPNIEAVFVNTGLEYPSVRLFAERGENVTVLRPEKNFREVICSYGYPLIGKQQAKKISEARRGNGGALKNFNGNLKGSLYDYSKYRFLLNAPFAVSEKCCDVMKKKPVHIYERKSGKKAVIATLAEESRMRSQKWLTHGCNAFQSKKQISKPMSFWTENDVLQYIHENFLSIAEAYGEVAVKNDGVDGQINIHDYIGDYRNCQYETTGCKRTGCIFCMFGITQDKDRFIRLAGQEPDLCDYVMRGGGFNDGGMWQPDKSGLGYWFVIEWLNMHGNLKIGLPGRETYLSEYMTEDCRKQLEEKEWQI